MKLLAVNVKNYLYSIFWSLLLLFAFAMPLSQQVSIKILLILCVLAFFIKGEKYFFNQCTFHIWDSLMYIGTLLVGLLYTSHMNEGIKIIETKLSLIALPWIFVRIRNFDSRKARKLICAFCSGLLVACMICYFNAFYNYWQRGTYAVFFFYHLTDIIGFQPTYYAYYLIFGITVTVYAIYHSSVSLSNYWLILLILTFFLTLLLTGGWTAMSSLFFIFSFFILKYLFDKETRIKSIALVVIIVMLALLFLMPNLIETYIKGGVPNDYWERNVVWEAAIQANTSPLFGVGTGDGASELNSYYRQYGMTFFANSNYNSHNQFTQTYLEHGILGLFFLFLLLSRPLYLSLKHRKAIIALMLFPFVVYGITEAFLGRYQGVVFFAFLYQIVLAYFYPFKTPFQSESSTIPKPSYITN